MISSYEHTNSQHVIVAIMNVVLINCVKTFKRIRIKEPHRVEDV